MKILLVPKNTKDLQGLRKWIGSKKSEYPFVIGMRKDCKITKIKEFRPFSPRWISYVGIPIYYNY